MSDRLTFHQEEGKLAIKFDGKPIPESKHDAVMALLKDDMERRLRQLQKQHEETP